MTKLSAARYPRAVCHWRPKDRGLKVRPNHKTLQESIAKTLQVEHLGDLIDTKEFQINSYFMINGREVRISTVELPNYRPREYETMVFPSDQSELGSYVERYSTDREAIEGHWKMVEEIKSGKPEFINKYVRDIQMQAA